MKVVNLAKFSLIASFVASVTACSTIHFVNGPILDDETIVEREQWHHLGLNGLIEFSKPFDLNYNCHKQQWDSITVEKTLFNSLASLSFAEFPISIYAPWSIRYSCRDAIDGEKSQ